MTTATKPLLSTHQLIQQIKDGYVEVDMEGYFLHCNRAFEELIGYSIEELQGKRFDFITPVEWYEYEQKNVVNKIRDDGYSGLYEKEYIHKDGYRIPIEIEAFLKPQENGSPPIMWGLVREVLPGRSNNIPGKIGSQNELLQNQEKLVKLVDKKTNDLRNSQRKLKEQKEDAELINALNMAANEGNSLEEIMDMLADYTKNMYPGNVSIYYSGDNGKSIQMLNPKQFKSLMRFTSIVTGKQVKEMEFHESSGHIYFDILKEGKPCLFNSRAEIKEIMISFLLSLGQINSANLKGRLVKTMIGKISEFLRLETIAIVPMRANGKTIGLLDIGTRRRINEDEIDRLNNLAINITSLITRKIAETAIAESNERLAAIIEHNNAAVWSIDTNFRLLIGNSYFYHIFKEKIGLKPELGKDMFEHLPEAIYTNWINRYRRVLNGEIVNEIEGYLIDGRTEYFDISLHPIRIGEKITGISIFGTNITEKQIANMELKQTMADLERSNKELEQFAYVASHDLQEPLRKVKSFTDLFALRYSELIDEKASSYINHITSGADRMQTLISDLLAFSRVSTHQKSFEEFDPKTVVDQVIGTLQLAIEESNAEINCEDLPEIYGDPSQFGQLISNLLSNAIKFRKENGTPKIWISGKKVNDHACFTVADNGIGVDENFKHKVFEVFQRLHTRQEYPGNGIGLAICKKIVQRHKGEIWFEPRSPEGTEFTFTIPNKTLFKEYGTVKTY